MGKINLFGASGHSKVIKEIIESQGNFVGCLYDDNPHCADIHGIPVFNTADVKIEGPLIISIGSNKIRKKISEEYKVDFGTAVAKDAIVSKTAKIGSGTVIMQGAVIQSDAEIGEHCIINTGASVDHECKIGDYAHISPHATLCGGVHVGTGTWIGAGAVVIPGIRIGKWCIIGGGSVVIRDIPDGVTAYGNPCQIKK